MRNNIKTSASLWLQMMPADMLEKRLDLLTNRLVIFIFNGYTEGVERTENQINIINKEKERRRI